MYTHPGLKSMLYFLPNIFQLCFILTGSKIFFCGAAKNPIFTCTEVSANSVGCGGQQYGAVSQACILLRLKGPVTPGQYKRSLLELFGNPRIRCGGGGRGVVDGEGEETGNRYCLLIPRMSLQSPSEDPCLLKTR